MILESYNYIFTVFTPTYNRAYTLDRVYNSLLKQSFKNFEWLIVDDGSTDSTSQMIEEWKKTAGFEIRYFYQKNQGKHVASNLAVDQANGEFFLTIDSDDAFTENALALLYEGYISIPEESRNNFSAVTGLCQNQEGILIGDKFPKDKIDSNSVEMDYVYNISGDKKGFQKTSIMKAFRFPVVEGTNFVVEGLVWNQIARIYQTRYINKVICIAYLDEGTSLSRENHDYKKLAHASLPYFSYALNEEMKYLRHAPFKFITKAIIYIRLSCHLNLPIIQQIKKIKDPGGKILTILMSFPGYLIYLNDLYRFINISRVYNLFKGVKPKFEIKPGQR